MSDLEPRRRRPVNGSGGAENGGKSGELSATRFGGAELGIWRGAANGENWKILTCRQVFNCWTLRASSYTPDINLERKIFKILKFTEKQAYIKVVNAYQCEMRLWHTHKSSFSKLVHTFIVFVEMSDADLFPGQ